MALDHDDPLLDAYLAELNYLRTAGADFAACHPKAAAALELRRDGSQDPHVERLIESFAFLTARIQRDIEANFPEIPHALLGVLYPHLTAPVPSAAIARFLPDPEQSRALMGVRVPKGTRLFAVADNGADIPFRTCYPVDLWPLEVSAAEFLPPGAYEFLSGRADVAGILRLRVSCLGRRSFAEFSPERLRFFIDADHAGAARLTEILFAATRQVAVLAAGASSTPRLLPRDAIRAVGFADDEDVLPHPATAHQGYRLLQEFFVFPEKYQFFDLDIPGPLPEGNGVDLLFLLGEHPPQGVTVRAGTFRLNCTPVVNLFPRTSEPIRLDHARSEYRLQPDSRREDVTEVHSIVEVSHAAGGGDDGRRIQPYFSVTHDSRRREPQAFWIARRRPAARAGLPGSDVWLSFKDLALDPSLPADRVVFAHTLCTSRGAAALVPVGTRLHIEVDVPVAGMELATRPTAQREPPARGAALWRLVSHLSVNHLSLAGGRQGLDALKEILRLYAGDGPADRQMIDTLLGLETRRVVRRIGVDAWRGFCRGHEIALTVDEAPESGAGPFLFTAVLSRFFALYAGVDSFTQLVVHSRQRDRTWMTWEPMSGSQFLL